MQTRRLLRVSMLLWAAVGTPAPAGQYVWREGEKPTSCSTKPSLNGWGNKEFLNFDGVIANPEGSGYIALEITDSPCQTGTSLYCQSSSGQLADSGFVTVTPSTTYYVWVGEGFNNDYRPDIDLCLW